jgi:hypothetical protein
MSEERRNKQREREGVNESRSRKGLAYAVVLIFFAGAFFGGRYYKSHKYDSFAQCLASKNVKMYGLYWCPHCADQKEMFGASFGKINYVECAMKDKSGDLAPVCKAAGVKLFPSWQFGNEAPKEGVLSLEALSDKTGCALP